MISETEALLEPCREMLELYHSAYIELGRKSVNTQKLRWHNDRRNYHGQ